MTRSRLPLLAAALALPFAAAGAARLAPAAELAKITSGRVAGKPVDCITLRDIRSSRIVDGTAIVYEVGGTLYVNAPASGAGFLRSSIVLVTDTHSPQLCSIDTVRLYDQVARMPVGSVGLGKFVPYNKPKPAPAS